MKYTGTKRALEPKGSLTVTAWKVDNRKELQSRELRVAIDCISMERDSLLQICSICEYDEEKIKEKIYKIIGERGKLHNPYTESGGLFSGIVEEIAEDFHGERALKPGDRVVSMTTLTALPCYLESIESIDFEYGFLRCKGYAICFETTLLREINQFEPRQIKHLLRALNEEGNFWGISEMLTSMRADNCVIIGNSLVEIILYARMLKNRNPDVIITCLFYGAISGSAPATVAAVGSMTIPLLIELGYKKDFATAIVAVAGGLGVIIPPSIPFIMYAMATGESVSDLFLAGIVPGLMIGALLMFYAYYHCRRYGEDKEKIDAKVTELREKGFLNILKDSIWALISPVIVLGCIYAGIASPTEAAVISVFYALFVSLFIYKSIKVKEIWGIMVEAMKTYAPILFILAASTAFSRVLTLMQVPQTVSAWILAHFSNEIVLLIIINVFLLIVGMVMDTTPAILILSPILLPIVQSIGMNPIHFGVVMIVNLAIGFVTPPIGVNLFVASSLTDVPVMHIAKKALPMIGYFLLALLLLTFIPAISLFLL